MDTHYVYVLYCTRFDRLYIGMTGNLGERFLHVIIELLAIFENITFWNKGVMT